MQLVPFAVWLRERGLDFEAPQGNGHRPLHKAAYGGHVAFCRWLRDECGAVDDHTDAAGNYAADIAEMAGHGALAAWLRDECSGARARSCEALGLPPTTMCEATIRARYLELARTCHPDRCTDADAATATERFERIRAAYTHLTEAGGRGSQANPTHSLRRMLAATAPAPSADAAVATGDSSDTGDATATATGDATATATSGATATATSGATATGGAAASRPPLGAPGIAAGGVAVEDSTSSVEGGTSAEASRCFKAKLAAVCHEHGESGVAITSLRKKYAEVWRGETLPPPESLGLHPRTGLRALLGHYQDTVRVVDGAPTERAPPRVVAVVSRASALGHARGDHGLKDALADAARLDFGGDTDGADAVADSVSDKMMLRGEELGSLQLHVSDDDVDRCTMAPTT